MNQFIESESHQVYFTHS